VVLNALANVVLEGKTPTTTTTTTRPMERSDRGNGRPILKMKVNVLLEKDFDE
jgi:hypothetical protein